MPYLLLYAVTGGQGLSPASDFRSLTLILAPRETPPKSDLWEREVVEVGGKRTVKFLSQGFTLVVTESADAYIVSNRVRPLDRLGKAAEILKNPQALLGDEVASLQGASALRQHIGDYLGQVLPLHGPANGDFSDKTKFIPRHGVVIQLQSGGRTVDVTLNVSPFSGLTPAQRKAKKADLDSAPVRLALRGRRAEEKMALDVEQFQKLGSRRGYVVLVVKPSPETPDEKSLDESARVVKDLSSSARRALTPLLNGLEADYRKRHAQLFGCAIGEAPSGDFSEQLRMALSEMKVSGLGTSEEIDAFMKGAVVGGFTPTLGVSLSLEPELGLVRVPIYP
jgi:hypothetical protein